MIQQQKVLTILQTAIRIYYYCQKLDHQSQDSLHKLIYQMSHTDSRQLTRQVSSSLQTSQKIQKKITQHIRQIFRQNNSTLSQKHNKKPEQIPQKIIEKSKITHKYLYKKTLINTQFDWLNKYLESSELQSLSVKVKPSKIELRNRENQQDKEEQDKCMDCKKNKRSKTQGLYCDGEMQNLRQKDNKKDGDKPFFSQNSDRIFRERSLNRKMLSQNHFRLKKSKSLKQKNNHSPLDDEHLRRMLMDENKINRSNCKQQVNSNSRNVSDKQNHSNGTYEGRRQKGLSIFIDQNTPVKQFLDITARMNRSNLMLKNKSGQIKNRKRQYIYQSREEKRQQSELLKIKKRCEEEISVEPWNLAGNDEKEQNQENDFIMNKHR